MRIATYNVEWFSSLFDDHGRILDDMGPSARYKVTRRQQLESLALVLGVIDPDGIMIIEAPDNNRHRKTVPMLERFARRYGLRQRDAVIGFESETQQEIAFLYDPDHLVVHHDPQGGPNAPTPRFDSFYLVDLDLDGVVDKVVFSKPPLELTVETRTGARLRLIGAHLKTKAPHGATNPEMARRIAIDNRRKQLTECVWLRARIREYLQAHDSVMVMGDLNDGPGLDEYEKLFGKSGVEIVLGSDDPPELQLYDPHAQLVLGQKAALAPTSARFYNGEQKRFFTALLDYVMVSPDLKAKAPVWRIWHPFDDPACFAAEELREALLMASDHFPVTVDIDL